MNLTYVVLDTARCCRALTRGHHPHSLALHAWEVRTVVFCSEFLRHTIHCNPARPATRARNHPLERNILSFKLYHNHSAHIMKTIIHTYIHTYTYTHTYLYCCICEKVVCCTYMRIMKSDFKQYIHTYIHKYTHKHIHTYLHMRKGGLLYICVYHEIWI